MKKIALISTYCDTAEKKEVLRKNLIKLKELGIETLVLSPIAMDTNLISLANFFIYTQENPVLKWPVKAQVWWKTYYDHNAGKNLRLEKFTPDYGWAALYQIKKMSEFALTFKYDVFFLMIYDLVIDENVKTELLSNNLDSCVFSRSDSKGGIFAPVTLHLLKLHRQHLQVILNDITLDNYLSHWDVAEHFGIFVRDKLKLNTSNTLISDSVFYYDGIDFYNASKSPQYKMFMGKDIDCVQNFKVLFYDVKENLFMKVNDKVFIIHKIDGCSIIETDILENDIVTITVELQDFGLPEEYVDTFHKDTKNIFSYL